VKRRSTYFVGPNTAVVGSLRSGETILWPTEGMLVLIQKGVFLLDTEPGNEVPGSEKKICVDTSRNEIKNTQIHEKKESQSHYIRVV